MYNLPKCVQRNIFQAKRSQVVFLARPVFSVGAGSFYMLSLKRYSRWSLEGLHHVSLPAVHPWLSSLQIFLRPCLHVPFCLQGFPTFVSHTSSYCCARNFDIVES